LAYVRSHSPEILFVRDANDLGVPPPAQSKRTDTSPGTVTLSVKAVPGARQDQVVGWLAERLKIRVAAPPEGGRANAAICELIAHELGIKPAAVTILRGHASAEKTLSLAGISAQQITARWPRP
jgi:uncharacterized protein YggU (UPF0235/DUF167 family)